MNEQQINSITKKLIDNLNLSLANKFEISKTEELVFVPVNTQAKKSGMGEEEEILFVAVNKNSNQAKIKEYVNTVTDNGVQFINLSTNDFSILFDAFLKEFNAKYGVDYKPSLSLNESANTVNENSLTIDDDILDIDTEEDFKFAEEFLCGKY